MAMVHSKMGRCRFVCARMPKHGKQFSYVQYFGYESRLVDDTLFFAEAESAIGSLAFAQKCVADNSPKLWVGMSNAVVGCFVISVSALSLIHI